MKLIVSGVAYDGDARPFIGDLRLLKKEFGWGWGTVAAGLESIPSGTQLADIFDDPDLNEIFTAWMWMIRLRAGERDLTIEQVRETPWDEITIEGDAVAETTTPEAPDPTSAQTDSSLGGEREPNRPRKTAAKTPKTSKPKSTRA